MPPLVHPQRSSSPEFWPGIPRYTPRLHVPVCLCLEAMPGNTPAASEPAPWAGLLCLGTSEWVSVVSRLVSLVFQFASLSSSLFSPSWIPYWFLVFLPSRKGRLTQKSRVSLITNPCDLPSCSRADSPGYSLCFKGKAMRTLVLSGASGFSVSLEAPVRSARREYAPVSWDSAFLLPLSLSCYRTHTLSTQNTQNPA